MPKRRSEELHLLAGDISVSLCPVTGSPVASLAHPDGGSCQIAVRGAEVISWRPACDGGSERLLPVEADAPAPIGGLQPVGLSAAIPAEAWTVEALVGRKGAGSPVAISIFAEVPAIGVNIRGVDVSAQGMRATGAGAILATVPDETAVSLPTRGSGVPMAARAKFSLWPDRLLVELEVANVADDGDGSAARGGAMQSAIVDLGFCGFRGRFCPAVSLEESAAALVSGAPTSAGFSHGTTRGLRSAPSPPEDVFMELGIALETDGFSDVSMSCDADGRSMRIQALVPTHVALGPGDCLSGHIALGRST
mmetsp:Transcript_93674/g.269744  ORF Transcript_93674/g.269744 Transcript_93674/m.269744 type:complete len:308 (-) Transcript_93674:80-1003(-)